MSVFKQFLEDFQAEGEESGTYIRKINQLIEENNRYLNLDCNDLRTFPTTSKLYEQLILFPQKIIQVFDVVVNELVSTLHPSTPFSIHIHVFNIGNKHPMRDLSTDNIDQLVCVEGMITRVGDLIPDIRIATFVCSNCKHRAEVHRIGNRIDCPARCEQCHSPNTLRIDSTDCIFNDKQVVKMQEVPDQVPQGETPQSVTMFASEELFDCVKPGDKVEVTGIFRALPVRISPNRTTVRDVFNTFIDVLHYRKKVDKRFAVEGEELDDVQQVEEERRREEARLVELSHDENIYAKLTASIAPSIWSNCAFSSITEAVISVSAGSVRPRKLIVLAISSTLSICAFSCRSTALTVIPSDASATPIIAPSIVSSMSASFRFFAELLPITASVIYHRRGVFAIQKVVSFGNSVSSER